jgi:hypothetical protein
VGAAGLGGLGPLDAAMIDGLAAGTAHAWAFQSYLASTKRHGWPAAQGLVDMGLRRGGKAIEQVAQTLMRLNPKPDAAYVQSVIDGYDLSEGLVRNLKANFGLN